MVFRPALAVVLAVSCTSTFAQSNSINHEVGIGISDLRSVNDNFFGVSYRYYLDAVNIDQQPWSISPYLQRTNNVSINYFRIDDNDRVEIDGEWFTQQDWIVRGRYSRAVLDEETFKSTTQRLGADVAKLVTPNWEFGAGLDYYDFDERDRFVIPGFSPRRFNKSELAVNVFARYTSFDASAKNFTPGWDATFQVTDIEENYILELSADYYLSANWSLGASYIRIDNERGNSDNILEIGTDYWFTPHSSIQFGLGFDTDDNTLGSLTLLGTFRL